MSVFQQIISAIDNPNAEASTNQLGSIIDTVQQLSQNYDTNPDAIQSALSIVGNYTKSALQEKRSQGGAGQVNQIINQLGGTGTNSQALSTLFNSSQVRDMIQKISHRTGLSSGSIQAMLPILVPLVLFLLKTGNNKLNILEKNPVVSDFLDSDGDGDVDINDAVSMAYRYLGR